MLRKKMSRPHSRSESHPKMLSCFTTTTDSFAGQSISVCVRLVDAEALEEVSDARLVPHILTLSVKLGVCVSNITSGWTVAMEHVAFC